MNAAFDQRNSEAREVIMQLIRAKLAESARLSDDSPALAPSEADGGVASANCDLSAVAMFRNRLESVGGHCIVACNEDDARQAVAEVVRKLQNNERKFRVALSDARLVFTLARQLDVKEIAVNPPPAALFNYDVGITTAQIAIAETGTLVLETEKERNRLVSLLPPIHIAIVNRKDFCWTIGEALARLQTEIAGTVSRAISFITGPSRTADIELTLTVGVHGPKELYVIVIDEDEAN